jgi:hypothetical protein
VQIRCNSFAKQTKTQRAALRERILAAVVVFTLGGARNGARFVAGVAPRIKYIDPQWRKISMGKKDPVECGPFSFTGLSSGTRSVVVLRQVSEIERVFVEF